MSMSSHALDRVSVPRSQHFKGPFGRMFRYLDVWQPTATSETEILAQMSAFAETAMAEGDDPLLDNANLPAGYTYFGQFVDHDITLDTTSVAQRQGDPNKLHNFRTPRLDLDCIYGEGPEDEPFMYDNDHGGMLLIGQVGDTNEPDLPRNAQGRALIGDARNDENTIVSQFQLAMLRLHNRIYGHMIGVDPDNLSEPFPTNHEAFAQAQRRTRWFYQYVVWNDFVKRLISDEIWARTLKLSDGPAEYGGLFYNWTYDPFIPLEFAVSAYRFGHSLIRPGYQVNVNEDVGLGFGLDKELPIFAAPGSGKQDLSGFRALPARHTVQWDWFFDFAHEQGPFPQPARRIDPALSPAVDHIPDGQGGSNLLAFLNLQRSWRREMPKGTAVAAAMGVAPLLIDDPHEDILWHYILKEASVLPGGNAGRQLGRVGGTIVGEVFGGLLYGDPNGYVRNAPAWTPGDDPVISALLPDGPENGGDWQVADLLRAAGAPVTAPDVASTIATGHN